MDDDDGSTYSLKKFDPMIIENKRLDPNQGPPSIILLGSKRTGKTYLIRDLMSYLCKIPQGIIITGSEGSSEVFSTFFPKSCIFDSVDQNMLNRFKRIIKTQRKLRAKKSKEDYSCFILFDDCGYDNKTLKETVMNQLFMNGRHYKILIIMAVQYCRTIPPPMRQNADYVFIMRTPSYVERKKIWEDFGASIPDINTFNCIMDKCTENYGCVMLDKTTISNKIERNVFWYRAQNPPPKPFKVGSEQLWYIHNNFYASETESLSSLEEEDIDDSIIPRPSSSTPKLKAPSQKVNGKNKNKNKNKNITQTKVAQKVMQKQRQQKPQTKIKLSK